MQSLRFWPSWLGLALCLWSVYPVQAQPMVDPGDTIKRILAVHPAVRKAELEMAAADALVSGSRAQPNPVLALAVSAGFKLDGMTEQMFQGPRGYVWALKPDADYDTLRSLRQAILSGSAKSVTALLHEGLSPDTTFDGFSGLHFAAGDGRRELIKLLLKAGASVDARCWGGGTPLYIAIQMGQLNAARQLVEAGADPSLTDQQGNTLLHVAGRTGRMDVVQWLLKLRSDPRAKNSQGETPEVWASRSGFNDVATMLRIAGEKPFLDRT